MMETIFALLIGFTLGVLATLAVDIEYYRMQKKQMDRLIAESERRSKELHELLDALAEKPGPGYVKLAHLERVITNGKRGSQNQ